MAYSTRALACVCVALLGGTTASAAVIAEHVGKTNPTLGSPTTWTLNVGGSGSPVVQIAFEDGPPPSVLINDSSNRSAYYTYSPSAQDHLDAANYGWKLSALIRVNNTSDTIGDSGITVQYNTADGNSYTMEWGSNADGEPIVGVQLGARPDWQHTVEGSNTTEFNLYELVVPAGGTSASLYINSVLVRSDIGARNGSARVLFGAGSSSGTGSGSYAMVRLETLPEPASLALLGVGAGLIGFRRRA